MKKCQDSNNQNADTQQRVKNIPFCARPFHWTAYLLDVTAVYSLFPCPIWAGPPGHTSCSVRAHSVFSTGPANIFTQFPPELYNFFIFY